ncbi:MAG: heat-inducible transcription repressor HrcA [Chloroflexi bacterium HGW-Chloroflexi-9]|nr:MAG: heat-inducible transcription repressor HrcA [Chloroflexi bacterium HGW-Chloroflexi-9]
MLTDRQSAILGMVVDEYVETAEPVSSRALVDRHRLEISSATIRNEMARLEREGYITHPYTSAGRIPSDLGYRFYVEALMSEAPVALDERRTVEHQLHQVAGGLDEWLSLTATILSSLVGNVAVVTRPRTSTARLRHAQLVELSRDTALLVSVMDDGRVRQRILQQRQPVTQDQLNARATRLNGLLAGADAANVRDRLVGLEDPDEVATARAVAESIEELRIAEETFLDGLNMALRQPEFSDVDRMLEAVTQLQAYRLRGLLESTVDDHMGSTRVIIGQENPDTGLQDWSVVVSRYGDTDAAGVVAVIGPTRMAYQRTIPRVRYIASLMGQILRDVGQ